MKVRQISASATAYCYDEIFDYSTYVIYLERPSKIFIIDTFCGSSSMAPILDRIKQTAAHKDVFVINTHFHWDHVWGNCSFREHPIISHTLCREELDRSWDVQLQQNQVYVQGTVEKHLPTITFGETLIFQEDGLELFHSPGHTLDSISVFDHNEKILYVGDNLEKPIIYVEQPDLSLSIRTLEKYLTYAPRKIIAGHTLELRADEIHATIQYLKGLSKGTARCDDSAYARKVHAENQRMVQQREKEC